MVDLEVADLVYQRYVVFRYLTRNKQKNKAIVPLLPTIVTENDDVHKH